MSPAAFHVAALRPPTDSAEAALRSAGWAWRALHELTDLLETDARGNDDLIDPFETFLAHAVPSSSRLMVAMLCLAGEPDPPAGVDERSGLPFAPAEPREVLGEAVVSMSLVDNPAAAFGEVGTHPDHRGRGVGRALADAAEAVAARHGRTSWMTWTIHRHEAAPDDRGALLAPTGAGRVPRTRDTAFALARGFTLEQTDRQSTQELPGDEAACAALWADVERSRAAAPGEYEVLSFRGDPPEEFVDDFLVLMTRMSTDAPNAGLDRGEEHWDRARWDEAIERRRRAGREAFTSVARHVPSGRLVAFTDIVRTVARPRIAFQHSTLVLREHRGHRLGQWVKLANLDLIAREAPEIARVHTWNAGENEWMLRINVAMGYAPATLDASWQRRVSP